MTDSDIFANRAFWTSEKQDDSLPSPLSQLSSGIALSWNGPSDVLGGGEGEGEGVGG